MFYKKKVQQKFEGIMFGPIMSILFHSAGPTSQWLLSIWKMNNIDDINSC